MKDFERDAKHFLSLCANEKSGLRREALRRCRQQKKVLKQRVIASSYGDYFLNMATMLCFMGLSLGGVLLAQGMSPRGHSAEAVAGGVFVGGSILLAAMLFVSIRREYGARWSRALASESGVGEVVAKDPAFFSRFKAETPLLVIWEGLLLEETFLRFKNPFGKKPSRPSPQPIRRL